MTMLAASTLIVACQESKQSSDATSEAPKSMVDKPATTTPEPANTPAPSANLSAEIAAGKAVYEKVCQACHQADGKGLPKTFPPLASSDYLAADLHRAIGGVVNGLSGEITVNGEKFNQTMPAATLTDEEVAAAFTYVLNSFGNKGGDVNPEDVKATRK